MLRKIYEVADAPILEMGQGNMFCIPVQLRHFGYFSEDMVLYAQNELLEAWHSDDDLLHAAEYGKSFFLDTAKYSDYLDQVVSLLNSFPLSEEDFVSKIEAAKSAKAIKRVIKEISAKQTEVFCYFNTTNPQFTSGLEQTLLDKLKSSGVTGPEDAVAVLSAPSKKSTLEVEQEEFYLLIKDKVEQLRMLEQFSQEILSNVEPEILAKLSVHSRKYKHLSGNEGADEWDLDYYIKTLKSIIEEGVDIETELKKIEDRAQKSEKVKNALTKKYKLGKNVLTVADILSNLGHYRLELRILWSSYFRLLRRAVYKLANTLEIPAYDLMSLSPEDLEADTDQGSIRSKFKTKDRYRAYLYVIKDHKVKSVYFGDDAISLRPQNSVSRDSSNNDLTGMVAYKGIVEGSAYVLNWGDPQFNKKMMAMPKGSIIVIGNTRPSLMPAIRKASAIVTDEGGITSHAAIVSRELKIPCIIGTQEATKIIKMGATIRVDAEKGVVSILAE